MRTEYQQTEQLRCLADAFGWGTPSDLSSAPGWVEGGNPKAEIVRLQVPIGAWLVACWSPSHSATPSQETSSVGQGYPWFLGNITPRNV